MMRDEDENFIHTISIDVPIGDNDSLTIEETLKSDFDIDKEIFENKEDSYSSKMKLYLSKLSTLQKSVLNLITYGYSSNEIVEELHISKKQYADCISAIHSYKNVSILF